MESLVIISKNCPILPDALVRSVLSSTLPGGFCPTAKRIWVDTGMCGFFDAPALGIPVKHEIWYCDLPDKCEKLIDYKKKQLGGVLPYGTVSSAGYGDGNYTCCFRKDNNGSVDAAFLRFL